MAAEEPALTRPVDPDDIGKYAKFDGTDVVWDTPAGGSGGGTPGVVGDLSAIEIGDAATAGATGRYADAAHQHALPAPSAPAALGASAAAGASTAPARADHVHPYPTAAQIGAATSGHTHAGVYEPAGSAAAAVAAHDADTSVHGIPDTSALLDTGDIGVIVQGYSAVLAATTASFTTADETKLDGIEAGATADMSAAEILAALLTVDGAGSGLDADLLDGNSSAAFATAGHNHDATYQPLDSDLTAIAALTTTVFGRALLALADAAALRTAADVGAQAVGGDLTGTVGNAQIAAGAVGATELASDAVTNAKVADDAIGIAELSATGTPSSSTFLRGDNTWATPSGGDGAVLASQDTKPATDGSVDLWYETDGPALYVYDSNATDFVEVGGGGGQLSAKVSRPGYGYWHYSPYLPTPVGAAWPIINRAYVSPNFFEQEVSITALAVNVSAAGAASNVVRIGVYSAAANGTPGTILGQGTVAGDSTGYKTLTLGTPITLSGFFWIVAAPQGSGAPGSTWLTTPTKGWVPQFDDNGASYVGATVALWSGYFSSSGSFTDNPTITWEAASRTPYVPVRIT